MRSSPSRQKLMELREPEEERIPRPLSALSQPPTEAELSRYEDVPLDKLPPAYFRNPQDRIYVNRDLRLDKIAFVGFDMDFTLAVYNDAHDHLTFETALAELVKAGYPRDLLALRYDSSYPIRGLILEIKTGNFLKCDSFGHVSKCYHGSREISKKEMADLYPSLMIDPTNTARYYSVDTLYSVCEAGLYRQMVDYLEKSVVDVSFVNLFQDVRETVDRIHRNGMLKGPIMADPGKYIHKAPQLAVLLDRLRKANVKSFLLTNSDFQYSKVVMNYLLGEEWKQGFDYIIVSAAKPTFFREGSQLREVDLATGNLRIGKEPKELVKGQVYSGGSIELFEKLTGARGDKVLYVGDHIFSDVVVSKQRHFWRTLLVVREMEHEIARDNEARALKLHLRNLEVIRRETHRGLDSTATVRPDMRTIQNDLKATHKKIDALFNVYWGSMFRSGTKHSHFSIVMLRYADLYTSHFGNLVNYPLFYLFSSVAEPLPHEDQ